MKTTLHRTVLVCACMLSVACKAASNGGVTHPEAGMPSQAEVCAKAPAEERNCMACASKPGCGFCAEPNGAAPICQPGNTTHMQSADCKEDLIVSNEDCEAPPEEPDAATH